MSRPLEGLLVLDFGRVIAAPRCARYLADLGAEVIHIERQLLGDDTRLDPQIFETGLSGAFIQENWGKRSLSIDLKHRRAKEILSPLIAKADVLIENFRPGVMRSLGLDYPEVEKINPTLVMCSISAYGQTGPYSPRVGYGFMADAIAGIPELTGEPDGPPMPTSAPLADNTAALQAVGLICAALIGRAKSGRGTYIDLSLLDATFGIHDFGVQMYLSTGGAVSVTRRGLRDDLRVPWGYFRGRDGWVCILCGTEAMWEKFAAVMGRPEMAQDARFSTVEQRRRNRAEVYQGIENWLAGFDRICDVVNLLSDHNIPCAPVNTMAQAIDDPQVRARQLIIECHHPVLGTVKLQNFLGVNLPPGGSRAAPLLGEHNREIAIGVAGLSEELFAELVAEGCLGKPLDLPIASQETTT
jgi:crotonobetainyl-CoA:carnitine CoA-transferase CaiB-like acyl-CoA transferase